MCNAHAIFYICQFILTVCNLKTDFVVKLCLYEYHFFSSFSGGDNLCQIEESEIQNQLHVWLAGGGITIGWGEMHNLTHKSTTAFFLNKKIIGEHRRFDGSHPWKFVVEAILSSSQKWLK